MAKVMRELAPHEHGAITKGPPAAVVAPGPPPRPPPRAPAPRAAVAWRDPVVERAIGVLTKPGVELSAAAQAFFDILKAENLGQRLH